MSPLDSAYAAAMEDENKQSAFYNGGLSGSDQRNLLIRKPRGVEIRGFLGLRGAILGPKRGV